MLEWLYWGPGSWVLDLSLTPYICDLDFERPQRIPGKGPCAAEGGWLLVTSLLSLGPQCGSYRDTPADEHLHTVGCASL